MGDVEPTKANVSTKEAVEAIPEEQVSTTAQHDDDKGTSKPLTKQVPPPKPARSSLANRDPKMDSEFTSKKAHATTEGTCRSKLANNNGETTENEADVSSLSSQDETEERPPGETQAMAIPRAFGYERLQSAGGDTSGGEDSVGDQSTSLGRSQFRDRQIRQDELLGDKEAQTTLKFQSTGFSQDLLKSPAVSEAHAAGAILDLSGEAVEQQFSENRYLAGLEMHEFHSSSAPAVSCELRMDYIGGRERGRSVAEVKELAYARLQEELLKAQEELKLKDEEVARLSRIRDEVLAELEELTASLFQEAHEMVREANIKQAFAEKALKEANMKTDVLQAELKALKALVITSTPSMPNRHLHPHLDTRKESSSPPNNGISFLRSHRRSPSHNNLKYGRDPTPPSSPEKELTNVPPFCPENYEIDPIYHKEFVSWRENPIFDKSHDFLIRIYQEDIEPCLNFTNRELASKVQLCVESNSITIEAVSGKSSFPKRCALSEAPRLCKYRMRLNEDGQWFYISQLCRNRIAAVCDFLSYLRYIQQGLVRSGVHDVYWEIIRLRKNMALARLGINS